MNGPDTTSRAVLSESAYKDERHLAARQSLYSWQRPRHDLPGIVLDHLPVKTGVVLDVGCGNGKYVSRIRTQRPNLTVLGLDISSGILAGVEAPVVVADAAALPASDGCADAILAMHMLYHVDDLDAALSEAARVLVPGGTFVVSTNARDDKKELDDLWASAAADVLGTDRGPRRISLSDHFSLDDAPTLLRPYFSDIRVLELPGVISVTETGPVIAHLASYRTWADSVGVPFDATLDRARQRLHELIQHNGTFDIHCRGGILLCRT